MKKILSALAVHLSAIFALCPAVLADVVSGPVPDFGPITESGGSSLWIFPVVLGILLVMLGSAALIFVLIWKNKKK